MLMNFCFFLCQLLILQCDSPMRAKACQSNADLTFPYQEMNAYPVSTGVTFD